MASQHSIKIGTETYAHVILAASETGQTISEWMEHAARAGLKRQRHEMNLSRYRQAEIDAANRLEGAPLRRDFGLPEYHG